MRDDLATAELNQPRRSGTPCLTNDNLVAGDRLFGMTHDKSVRHRVPDLRFEPGRYIFSTT